MVKSENGRNSVHYIPSTHARSDPEAFWLRPVMAITASYGHYGQRAARIGPDSICLIRLPALSVSAPFFQRRRGSDLDGLVRVRQNASGLEANGCAGIIGPGFWQDAPGPLPVSHFQTRFRFSTDVPDNIV